ncbi:MAG: AAA family ATPase [Candidatus Sungbacteria bacterium]|nr:AAA family ATPase [Candidatus Sungbacteria bacterium]
MKKIVVTGADRGGKSMVIESVKKEFSGQVIIVPEVATMLLSGGFPIPGKDIRWSPEWQAAFQKTVLFVQIQMEAVYELKASEEGALLLICDRGKLDGAGFTPGGLPEFCQLYGVNAQDVLASYEAVYHLESTAVGDPEDYERDRNANNAVRFRSCEEAAELDHAIRAAWQTHASWNFLSCVGGLEGKKLAVCHAIRWMIAEGR